jgi:hypothetical protein
VKRCVESSEEVMRGVACGVKRNQGDVTSGPEAVGIGGGRHREGGKKIGPRVRRAVTRVALLERVPSVGAEYLLRKPSDGGGRHPRRRRGGGSRSLKLHMLLASGVRCVFMPVKLGLRDGPGWRLHQDCS